MKSGLLNSFHVRGFKTQTWHLQSPTSACLSQELENLAPEREKASQRISYKFLSKKNFASVASSLLSSPSAEFYSPALENEVVIREPQAASGLWRHSHLRCIFAEVGK